MIKNLLRQDENQLSEIKSKTENLHEIPKITVDAPSKLETSDAANAELFAETKLGESQSENSNERLFQTAAEPESIAETARKSGLAYGAAITLFGSIVFMLILGWFADLLLETKPWGIVGGIVLGAAVGFFQFFRITSQIFKNKD